MNRSAPPPPPPGLGDLPGIRQAHAGHLPQHHTFLQSQLALFLPSDLASATALLQQYRMELQQQQSLPASLGALPTNLNSRAGVLQPYARDAAKAADDTPADASNLREADAELQLLLEIASGAFVNNKIDLSLLSFKQRLAIADLVRYKQSQLQQMSQQASLLLHQLEKNREGYVDSSKLLLLFPNARAALAKCASQGSGRAATDIGCLQGQWLRAYDAATEGSRGPRMTASGSPRMTPGMSRMAGTATAETLGTVKNEHEHGDDMLAHAGQPFTRNNTRSRTTPAIRGSPESWLEKPCGETEDYSSTQEGDLFKQCFSMSSSLAEAAATTSAETPAGGLEDRARDDSEGDVSTLLEDLATLHTQQGTRGLQKVVEAGEEPDDGVPEGQGAAEGTPFFQRNMRRTTTVPNGSFAGKVMMFGGNLDRESLPGAGTGSLPDFSPQTKSDMGSMWNTTPAARNGRCVRIDTNALAAALRPDYGNIAGNDMAALLGDLKLLQEASATVHAATRSTPTNESNALFQRNNRRTTTLPGTMANIKIRATDVQRMLHTKGRCKPCAFYYNKRKGCRNGSECEFCHHEEHSKLTLKQWKKHQQRAHRTRLLEDCDGAEGSGILSGFQSPGVMLDSADSGVPTFAQGHAPSAADVQHPVLPRQYALNSAGFTAESLAQVRERLAELTSAAESALPEGS